MPPHRPSSVDRLLRLLGWIIRAIGELVGTLFYLILELIQLLAWLLTDILCPLGKTLSQSLQQLIRSLPHRKEKFWALLLLIPSLFFLLANFGLSAPHAFEGNILAQDISFTYTGTTQKLFLADIHKVASLDLGRLQSQTLILNGTFETDNPELQPQLNGRSQLTLNLERSESRLIITPLNPQETSLEILGLYLQPNTQVQNLSYRFPQTLDLCLSAPSDSSEICLFPDLQTSDTPTGVGKLNLNLRPTVYQISLENFSSPELGIAADNNTLNSLEFQFIPNATTELELQLTSPCLLSIALSELSPGVQSARWIRGNLETRQVHFSRQDLVGDVSEQFPISTILGGEVRIGDRSLQLQPNQFLIVDKPGVQKILNLTLQAEPTESLEVRFSGKSKELAIGLDTQFPVQKIKPSWLTQYLPPDQTLALLSFIAAIIGFLLPYLFTNA